MQHRRFTTIYSSWSGTISRYPAAGKTTTVLLNMPRAAGAVKYAPDQSEAFWQIKHLVMKATLWYLMFVSLLLCACSIISYHSFLRGLLHGVIWFPPQGQSCGCINKSLSPFEWHWNYNAWPSRDGGREGEKRGSFACPLAWLNFLIRVSTLL